MKDSDGASFSHASPDGAAAAAEQPDRVLEVVAEALERGPAERADFLREACAGDEQLRTEVESLLAGEDTAGEFLNTPAFAEKAGLLFAEESAEFKSGDRLGDCEIIRLLGEGGSGEVYLARDTGLERQVAVKLLKRHLSDDSAARHFRHERRILAALTHPNIARLYGGATTPEGRPYLVMEYVEGERFDHFFVSHSLDLSAQLALFRKVCAAVSYAHQNLVVHRDLKPANIRVTPEGEPKLLDFGIAKLLDPDGTQTQTGGLATMTLSAAMTPEYASPEQIRGAAITTASDVYSLGVILYELLTGQRPFVRPQQRPDELARAICEEEPARPSTVIGPGEDHSRFTYHHSHQLRGDLDNIVAMALRKEPERRYHSVAQFSEDLRRHCEGLPVFARKDMLGYRAGKFVRRNKAGVAAAALVVLALIAGLVATTIEARRANRRFEDVRRLANSILFEIEPQIANLPGSTPARSLLVKRALEYLDSLAREAGNNRQLRGELATAYEKVGDVQGNPGFSNLGHLKEAENSYRKAADLRRALVQADPRDAQARHQLAANYENLGGILWWSNATDRALQFYRDGLLLREQLLREEPHSTPFRQGYASLQLSLGDVAAWNNRTAEALANFQKARPILEALAAERPADAEQQINLARCLSRIGVAQKDSGNFAAAADTFNQAVKIVEPLARPELNNYSAQLENWFILNCECEALNAQKLPDQALAVAPQMLHLIEALARRDPQNTETQHNLAVSHSHFGEAFFQAGRWPEAIDEWQHGLEIDGKLAEHSPENGEYAHSLGTLHASLGRARLRLNQTAQAQADEETAETLLNSAAAKDPENFIPRRELVQVFTTRGEICEQTQQREEARSWFQRALTQLNDLVAQKLTSPGDAEDFALLQEKLHQPHDGGGR